MSAEIQSLVTPAPKEVTREQLLALARAAEPSRAPAAPPDDVARARARKTLLRKGYRVA